MSQVNNLASNPQYQVVKDSLADVMLACLKATGDPRADGNDSWQEFIYHQYSGFGMVYNKILPVNERARLRPVTSPNELLNWIFI